MATAPTVPSNDILCKAQEMGVRVWTQDSELALPPDDDCE